jgi:hypothetical protein
MEHFAIKEDEGAEGLVLGGRRDPAPDREVLKEPRDVGCPKFGWVPFAAEDDISANPTDVGLLGAEAVVPGSDRVPDLIQQPGRTEGRRRRTGHAL